MAHQVGLGPIKINMVVKAGMNDQEILPMARHFKNTPYILRFIEYMDVGASNGWNLAEVIPSSAVIERIAAEMPLVALQPNYTGETAARWRYADGGGEIGVISSVTQAFCQDCTRARLSTEGKLFTCLFATGGHDLRALIRAGRSDAEISSAVAQLWRARGDRYSELRTINTSGIERHGRANKVEMSYIGDSLSFKQKVTALILAGGRGTRMGRVDKGLQPFRGATLVSHVMRRLAPQVGALTINANRNLPQYQALSASPPVPVWPDELTGFEGPLAGLQTGLRHCGTELLATAPCDSPFLPTDLIARLHAALLADDADLAIAVTMEADEDGRPYRQTHPVFTLMKAAVLPQLNAYLDTGARRLDGWHKAVRVTEGAVRGRHRLPQSEHAERASAF